jgi:hypothetical protein
MAHWIVYGRERKAVVSLDTIAKNKSMLIKVHNIKNPDEDSF